MQFIQGTILYMDEDPKPQRTPSQPPLIPEIHRVQRPGLRDLSAEDWEKVTGVELQPVILPENSSGSWWTKYKNPEDIPPGMRPIPPKDQKNPDSSGRQVPGYESNLVWGPLALGAGILLSVVAAMKHDLR